VAQDLEHLRGIDDNGDDLHGLVASRAAQGIRLVDCFREVKRFFSKPLSFFRSPLSCSFCCLLS
jgi:hypothetical protein